MGIFLGDFPGVFAGEFKPKMEFLMINWLFWIFTESPFIF